ncbi:MAG: RNA-binding S4 domain-containing protein [Erythrobacter sp.]|nr:RNA-binding S4 domain-containing protein [Erythrobacter sp.]
MKPAGETPAVHESIRVDRLLVYLRLARTRTAAAAMIEAHALRRNRKHVLRGAEQAHIGDILTIAQGNRVQVIILTAIPTRRGPPALARSHYREVDQFHQVDPDSLDRTGQMTLAASALVADDPSDASQDRF